MHKEENESFKETETSYFIDSLTKLALKSAKFGHLNERGVIYSC